MKPRKSLSIYVLLVGVLGLLIVAGIFAFQIIDEATKSQIPTSQREAVKPIDGQIENRTIESLQKRKTFSKDEILIKPITITPTLSQVATTASSVTSIQSASNSAETATSSAQKVNETN